MAAGVRRPGRPQPSQPRLLLEEVREAVAEQEDEQWAAECVQAISELNLALIPVARRIFSGGWTGTAAELVTATVGVTY